MVEIERLARELMRRNPGLTLEQAVEQVKQTPRGRQLWFAYTHANPVDDTNRDVSDPTDTNEVMLAEEDRKMRKQMAMDDAEDEEDEDEAQDEMPSGKQLLSALDRMADAARQPNESFERAYARLADQDAKFKSIYSKYLKVAAGGPYSRDFYPQGSSERLTKREPVVKAEQVKREAEQYLTSKAEEIRKSDPKLTAEQAYAKACEQHPESYRWFQIAHNGQPYLDDAIRSVMQKSAEAL